MRAWLAIAATLFAASAGAGERCRAKANGRSNVCATASVPPQLPDVQMLTAESTMSAAVADPCAYLASQSLLTGNWFCLNGAGAATGAQTLTPNNSPTTATWPMCSNGSDCDDYTSVRLNGTDQSYLTAGTPAAPAADFTACAWYRVDLSVGGSIQQLVTKDDETLGRSFEFEVNGTFLFAGINGSALLTSTEAVSTGGWHLGCFVFDHDGDGNNPAHLYHDYGVVGATTNTAGNIAASTIGYGVGYRPYTAAENYFKGNIGLAFFTETALSQAQVRALYLQLAPNLTASDSSAVTATRASSSWCENEASTSGSVIGANRPCVNSRALAEGTLTNGVIRSEQLGTSWTCTNVTVTSDQSASPAGIVNGDQIQSTANGAFCGSTAFALTSADGVGNASIWAWTAAGTQAATLVLRDTTANADRCTTNFTATTTRTRVSCSSATVTSTNNHQLRIYPGATTGQGTIYAWGGQITPTTDMRIYIPTAGTAVTRAADVLTFPRPTQVTDSVACLGADILTNTTVSGTRAFGFGAGANRIGLASATQAHLLDSTNTQLSGSASSIAGRAVRIIGSWSGSTMTASLDGEAASGSYDGSISADPIHLGSGNGSAGFLGGWIGNMKFADQTGGCE